MSTTEADTNDKVAALMKMFEEEKARHREAEMAAETRIRLLENKLKDVGNSNVSNNTAAKKKASTTSTTSATTPRRLTTSNNNKSKTPTKTTTSGSRETVTATEPRTSDSLFATPTKRKSFIPTTNNNADTQTPKRKVAGSPSGSPTNVASLPRASSAATSRSERLAAARAKRKEELSSPSSASTSKKTASSSSKTPTPASAAANSNNKGRARSFTPSKTTGSIKNNKPPSSWAGVNPAHEKAWKKFCETAKGQFSNQELVAVSNETLQQLMDHFSVNDPIERARIEAHWSYLNEMQKSNNTSNTNRSSSANQSQRRTPHRQRVKELNFPNHPDDFNLRTNIPCDPSFTPRKLLGSAAGDDPTTPRGCNIEAHKFTCPERKMRTLHLLRTRSPASSKFAPESADAENNQKNSKKIIECEAKLSNRADQKVESKKFYNSVPGETTVDHAEGKRRASAIPGSKGNNKLSEEDKGSSKKMNVPKPKVEDDSRLGIKIHVQNPTESKDAKRYARQAESAGVIRPVSDSTFTTVTLAKLASKSNATNNNNNSRAPRSLVGTQQQPSKFQLKTPFAVDS